MTIISTIFFLIRVYLIFALVINFKHKHKFQKVILFFYKFELKIIKKIINIIKKLIIAIFLAVSHNVTNKEL